MKSLINELNQFLFERLNGATPTPRKRQRLGANSLTFEPLQPRELLATTAILDGSWTDPATWSDGVPDVTTPAIIQSGVSVELDGNDHFAQTLTVRGELWVSEESGTDKDKTLTTRWMHVNSNGEFLVGSEADRYDQGTFTLNLTGTDPESDHVITTEAGSIEVMNNDGFLMTGMGGRVQFYGQDKLSFTKLATTALPGQDSIIVQDVIERNYNLGAMNGDDFVTSEIDDGKVEWEIGDQIVIASSSYDYTEEEVRTIMGIDPGADGTTILTLDSELQHRHFGEIESYGDAGAYQIDMRAEVALLSRNIKIQGDPNQDTDVSFGDRANLETRERLRAGGLSDREWETLPDQQVANGVGGHLMFMPMSGSIVIDGVQLDGLGQSSQKGRYPIHWHLGDSRPDDVFRNSSVTNSNNRGVTIHGTSDLTIEGVVLHDIHGHGFFFEDAVETGNLLVGNLALGIHSVGGNDSDFANPGGKDPFIVDTHDSVLETNARFSSSAAYWITNPNNTFVGNIAAGAGDEGRPADYGGSGAAGTGFWYAIPRTALGDSGEKSQYADVTPIFAEFGQFDYNTAHTTAVGMNFDRGSDIEDANFDSNVDFGSIQLGDWYSPRVGGTKDGDKLTNFVNGFTSYKAAEAAVYHRGEAESIQFRNLRIADSQNGSWAVSENRYEHSLFVGHSKGNADRDVAVGGPRLYDGAGDFSNTHFAGFADEDAFMFQVEGSSFGPTMYHAFRETSFENDGSFGNISHAVSDFQQDPADGHDLTRPFKWIKGVMDLDGTLTGADGGIGYSIIPNIDFLYEDDDVQPEGWDARLTDDIYGRIRVENFNDSSDRELFPSDSNGKTVVRFTARDGDSVDVVAGQNGGDHSWVQIMAKTDGDGDVEGTLTIEFGQDGVPENGFVLNMKNQDGGWPQQVAEIAAKVESARMVVNVVAAGNYTPEIGDEVDSESLLRTATDGVVYYRDEFGNLLLNTGIKDDQPLIKLLPGAPLQTPYQTHTIGYGTKIEAEAFDNGIDGIAYHDSDQENSLGGFRNDQGVDTSGSTIGNIVDGEWVEYTASITPSAYNIGLNVAATQSGGQVRVLAANSNSAGYLTDLGVVNVPDTQGEFQTVWLEGANLFPVATTDSVIRLEFVGGGFELDSMEFAAPEQLAYRPGLTIQADLATTVVELEEFDVGGQGVAYFDDSAGNESSDDYRANEDVDTSSTQLNGKVFEGEWLEYTVDVHAGLYDIGLNKKWGGENNGVKLWIGDSNAAIKSDMTLLGQFSFTNGDEEFLTLSDVDLTPWAGSGRVIRTEIVGNWMGLDRLEFTSKSQIAPNVDIVDVSPGLRNTEVAEVVIEFDEDVTGVDISDFQLTRDDTTVDISGLSVTQVTPRRYSVDLSLVTDASGQYEFRLNSDQSGIQDLAGNGLGTDAMDQFLIDMVGPQVESVVINDGTAQRSMVKRLTVTFSEEVTGVDASSFQLLNTTTNQLVVPLVSTELVNDKTVATLTFGGTEHIGGSLADGDYQLTVLAATVNDAAGNSLDGNGDGINGDDARDTFFRFFGDANGDRSVNISDFFQFRQAFGGSDGLAFDFNGDGDVGIVDFFQFRSRFGKTL